MSRKLKKKTGGKNGTHPSNQFPVDFNNDKNPRFKPGTLRQAGGSFKKPL